MSQITSPVILDSTGVRIAQAIEALGGGGGSAGYVTYLANPQGGEITDGTALTEEDVLSVGLVLRNGYLMVNTYLPQQTISVGFGNKETYNLLQFPYAEISEDYTETSFPALFYGSGMVPENTYKGVDDSSIDFYDYNFQFVKRNNVWCLDLVLSNGVAIGEDGATFWGVIDLHYATNNLVRFIEL